MPFGLLHLCWCLVCLLTPFLISLWLTTNRVYFLTIYPMQKRFSHKKVQPSKVHRVIGTSLSKSHINRYVSLYIHKQLCTCNYYGICSMLFVNGWSAVCKHNSSMFGPFIKSNTLYVYEARGTQLPLVMPQSVNRYLYMQF